LTQRSLLLETAELEYRHGNFQEALNSLEALLFDEPDNAEANFLAGICLHYLHKFASAESFYRKALAIMPALTDASNYLAHLLGTFGRFAEVEVVLNNALALNPASAALYFSLGWMLSILGRYSESIGAFRKCLHLNPSDFDAWTRLGSELLRVESYLEAEAALHRALAIKPDHAEAFNGMGVALGNLGDPAGSVDCFRRANALDAGNFGMHRRLVYQLNWIAENPAELLGEAVRLAERHETPLLQSAQAYPNATAVDRRLRIGYISADFRAHSHASFILPTFRNHDRTKYEIVCYSKTKGQDSVTQNISELADVWRDVSELDDAQTADLVRADQIDILVDTMLYAHDSAIRVFARRPAPVQIQWLAYPGTTGFKSVGYRITDPFIDPPDAPDLNEIYTEKLLRLRSTYLCFDPRVELENKIPTVGPLPARKNGYVTFGYMGIVGYLSDHTLRLWAAILSRLPQAHLLLVASLPARGRLARRFEVAGIDLKRVAFIPFQPRLSYLLTYNAIDISLESFPSNGYTTSLNAYWMGVPTPTLAGRAPSSRKGISLLKNLGLDELIATSDDEYVSIVVQLASDLRRLAKLRSKLRRKLERSPLMDAKTFTRSLEDAYRQAWREWCESAEA
jgi:protein O-GlcNAc transferase